MHPLIKQKGHQAKNVNKVVMHKPHFSNTHAVIHIPFVAWDKKFNVILLFLRLPVFISKKLVVTG